MFLDAVQVTLRRFGRKGRGCSRPCRQERRCGQQAIFESWAVALYGRSVAAVASPRTFVPNQRGDGDFAALQTVLFPGYRKA
jgi:hypothetical protein